jgi:hypothetical protein
MQRCNIDNLDLEWSNVLDVGCGQWKTKRMWSVLCRLVLNSAVYHLWRARNEIKHHGRPKTEEQVIWLIYWDIRSRISRQGKFMKTRENVALCLSWNIAFFCSGLNMLVVLVVLVVVSFVLLCFVFSVLVGQPSSVR